MRQTAAERPDGVGQSGNVSSCVKGLLWRERGASKEGVREGDSFVGWCPALGDVAESDEAGEG